MRVYNCDETGFPLAPKPKKVIVERGGNHHYQSGITNMKAQITVLLCASAVGHYTKPLIVYPGVQPQIELRQHFHDTFNEGLFRNSESGWMDTKLFAEWLEHGFNEDIKQCNITKPVILFIDGAKVLLSIEALEFCARNDIILYTLYPNATHLIPSLDLALMGSMKNIYKEEMCKWLVHNIGETFDKYRFVEVFQETYQRSYTVINAVQGFEKAGIVPWNPDKVKTGKLYPAELYTRQEPMPHVAADNSINEPRNEPQVASGTADMPEKVTEKTVEKVMEKTVETVTEKTVEKVMEKTVEKMMEKEDNKPIVITVRKKHFRLIEVDEEKPKKTRDETIEEVLEVPKPKNVKLGPCRVPGLLRCVSSQEFRDQVKEIEDRKKAKRDEIEKQKAERKAEAEQKREEKRKAAEARQMKKTTKKSRVSNHRKKNVQESSESEEVEDEPEYDDESSGLDEDEENALLYRCAECGERFNGAAR